MKAPDIIDRNRKSKFLLGRLFDCHYTSEGCVLDLFSFIDAHGWSRFQLEDTLTFMENRGWVITDKGQHYLHAHITQAGIDKYLSDEKIKPIKIVKYFWNIVCQNIILSTVWCLIIVALIAITILFENLRWSIITSAVVAIITSGIASIVSGYRRL